MIPDPELRRWTPLALKLERRIRLKGPITVREYMDTCLNDPEHGYYRTQRAIGRDGDFVTAPEISQVFGELIGLWAAVVWQQMGKPGSFNLVELGPGRGTLMADALRAARVVRGFVEAASVVMVEPNPILVAEQKVRLSGCSKPPRWLTHASEIEPGPAIVIANEVLDVVPVAQFVRCDVGWQERGVGLGRDGHLGFVPLVGQPLLLLPEFASRSRAGDIVERRNWQEFGYVTSRLASGGPVAVLLVDYGHLAPTIGDTLQAVRGHRYEHPLTSPGEADLTAQVEFSSIANEARGWGFVCHGPVTQAEFLGRLGIIERASRLMAANPAKGASIEAGVARLIAPGGMGTRFKVLGVHSSALPPSPGLTS